MIPFSVLDLSPIMQGNTPADALRLTLDLARHAERWGYNRFWLAEHHNTLGIACAATAVVISYVAGGTSRIRVGAGGVMLPNHPPLVVAEQFGTLASLYPGRIDLGLGRAPGTDKATTQALRRYNDSAHHFADDVAELRGYFQPPQPGQAVRAVPGAGLEVPMWILGTSLFSAQLAARLGLPYAFATHYAPGQMTEALAVYRNEFQPSSQLGKPYVMLGFNVYAAEEDAEAERLFTTLQQQFINQRRNADAPFPSPIDNIDAFWSQDEKKVAEQAFCCSAVGAPDTVRSQIEEFLELGHPDELLITSQIHDHSARLRSFEIAASILRRLGA
ncbi:LLM class flavin-dependent oxidoreductase [Corallococcus exercitus]|uniref:LLM class flavin-dependent oxidoreductase n=1 Tax=Corallococcus exercitus TaxID=2316736 RepID=UPI000EA02F14|nr:LLM class flavin-dependent oxidoreductase [Corallococcus exercitus]RKG82044.1 LLM class flavin-dependent oxidoreductase [Corallococcus exercitus]